jgi:hypothetical protein
LTDIPKAAPVEVHSSDLTLADWVRITWGFFWRHVCCALAGCVVGILLGMVIGLIAKAIGVFNQLGFQLFAGILGGLVGFCAFAAQIRWLLHARLGWFRFALVRTCEPGTEAASSPPASSPPPVSNELQRQEARTH